MNTLHFILAWFMVIFPLVLMLGIINHPNGKPWNYWMDLLLGPLFFTVALLIVLLGFRMLWTEG